MHASTSIELLSSATLFLVVTLLSSTYAQSTSNLTGLASYTCFQSEPFQLTRNGAPWNCAKAILQKFPTDTTTGVFHHNGEPDSFQLPRTSVVHDCVVHLDTEHGPVQGRWLDVWMVAQTLNTACTYYRNRNPQSLVTGGEVRFLGGDGNGLVLTMERAMYANASNVEAA